MKRFLIQNALQCMDVKFLHNYILSTRNIILFAVVENRNIIILTKAINLKKSEINLFCSFCHENVFL